MSSSPVDAASTPTHDSDARPGTTQEHGGPAVRVAFDVGPLSGRRTGIGAAVSAAQRALGDRADVELHPYLTSFRARPAAGTIRLPLPAAVAHRLWGRFGLPRLDRSMTGIQVVHGTNYVVPPSRLPRVVTVYDCWFLRHPEQAQPAVVRAGRVLARSIADGAVVHASSQATAVAVREHFPDATVEVIQLAALALPSSATAPPIHELESAPFVVAIGTLERRKNIPRLIEAFAMIAVDRPTLRLVLAGGDGDDRPAVDRAIDMLPSGVGARVLITGFVDDATRGWLLDHARVMAYPSLDEGFGFPLLDAVQARLPVVAGDVGSIPEVAGATALLVDPLDPAAIAARLADALDDDDLRTSMIEAGPGQLARFSWDVTAARLSELYHRLAGGKNP